MYEMTDLRLRRQAAFGMAWGCTCIHRSLKLLDCVVGTILASWGAEGPFSSLLVLPLTLTDPDRNLTSLIGRQVLLPFP